MKITSGTIGNFLAEMTKYDANFKSKSFLDTFKATKRHPHNIALAVRNYQYHSQKSKDWVIRIDKDKERITFKKKEKSEFFFVYVSGEGDLCNSVINFCAKRELGKIKEDIFLLQKDEILFAERNTTGVILTNPITKEGQKYLSFKEFFKIFCKNKQKKLEDKIVILVEH